MNIHFICKAFFRSEFPGISLRRSILLQIDKKNYFKKCIEYSDGQIEEQKNEKKLKIINKNMYNKSNTEDLTLHIFRATILHSQRINTNLLQHTINFLVSSS